MAPTFEALNVDLTAQHSNPSPLRWHRPSSLVKGASNLYAQRNGQGWFVEADVYRSDDGNGWVASVEAMLVHYAGSQNTWIAGGVPESHLYRGGLATQREAKQVAATLAQEAAQIASVHATSIGHDGSYS